MNLFISADRFLKLLQGLFNAKIKKHPMKNGLKSEIRWGSEVEGSRQAWVIWKSTAQPSFSIVTSVGCSLVSLSRGWQNYLLHQSWGWASDPHRGLHFTQPAPQWLRRHSQSRWSISGMAIHHFVLLKVFDCPAQLSGAASARSAIWLHRW